MATATATPEVTKGEPTSHILLQDTSTGELALLVDTWTEGYPDDSMRFMYEEGNYSCDCTRHLFFARALGRPQPEDRSCNTHENRFHVLAFEVTRDGVRYELTGHWQAPPVQASKGAPS